MAEAIIDIIVSPKSSQSKIVIKDDSIRVYLHSPPIDGKANAECVHVFSKKLKIAKSMITIQKGLKGKKKRIAIEGMSLDEVMNKLK